MQHTLKASVHLSGVGLHSGQTVHLSILPAPAHHGVVFERIDLSGDKARVPADYRHVSDTTLCTVIENGYGTKIGTVEHLMAALWGMGVDNALIRLDGPEVPIMDGSAEPFVFLIERAGTQKQSAPRREIVIDRPILVEDGESMALLEPHDGFLLDATIAFSHAAIGIQRGVYDFSAMTFKDFLSRARTFCFESDIEKMRAAGLARGGSLANAVVVGEDDVLNAEGLRYADEFVRHKALDCLGDYFMSGYRLRGSVTTRKPGHRVNAKLVKSLMAHRAAWHFSDESAPIAMPSRLAARAALAKGRPAFAPGLSGALHEADK